MATMLLSGQLANPKQQTDTLNFVLENVDAAKGMEVAKETMSKLPEKLPDKERQLLDALLKAKELYSFLRKNDKASADAQAMIIKRLEKGLPEELVYVADTLNENKAELDHDLLKGAQPLDT